MMIIRIAFILGAYSGYWVVGSGTIFENHNKAEL